MCNLIFPSKVKVMFDIVVTIALQSVFLLENALK